MKVEGVRRKGLGRKGRWGKEGEGEGDERVKRLGRKGRGEEKGCVSEG